MLHNYQHPLYLSCIEKHGVGTGTRTSFLVTGFSIKTTCVSLANPRRGSKSANSAILFAVSTRFSRFGIEDANDGWIWFTRLRASSNVRRRGKWGKFAREEMSLSVKSIASWSYPDTTMSIYLPKRRKKGGLTLAIPKFSIEGILCPIQRLKKERKEPIYQWCSHV